MLKKLGLIAVLLVAKIGFAQTSELKWLYPQKQSEVLQGVAWPSPDSANYYTRLPEMAKSKVRDEVWNLAKCSAGEYLDFETNAPEIAIKYQVSRSLAMPHMPATGVSGLDLWALDETNSWRWVSPASYLFQDTVRYQYKNITAKVKHYRLYLPLYNVPRNLKIGVQNSFSFQFKQVAKTLPIVIYGTSILQGACASRSGMAWSNILGRMVNQPIINLGFSGNGRLEPELMDLIKSVKSKLLVLDCQPNLHDRKTYSEEEITSRITKSVMAFRSAQPNTPILLVEHASGLPGINLDTALTNKYIWTSEILNNTYQKLKKSGVKRLFVLTAKNIGFNEGSTVDGTHPNDYGMMAYAMAYQKMIKQILR